VVEQVSKNPDQLKLGGEEKELTVLFSDIRGFSSISEGLSAGELVRLLNQYFAAMTELVFRDGGMLDKYLGDGIMAVYGAPLAFPNHAYQACNTALRMLSRLEMLQTNWRAAGLPRIDIGIGINSGRMVVGNMGSEDYLEYTVIGDEVNLASRLEGANKEYATHIIISESTWEHVKDRIATRELDIIQVKGKKRPTRIFEVLGFLPLDGVELQKAQQFEAGVHAYRERRWRDAIDSFHRSLALAPGDHPSQLYIRRCEEFLASPPPADWDGVYRMKTK
jgi:adenylate cyclase